MNGNGDKAAAAQEELAKRLYVEMETDYPGPDEKMLSWEDARETTRIYFKSCVEYTLQDKELVIQALGFSLPITT